MFYNRKQMLLYKKGQSEPTSWWDRDQFCGSRWIWGKCCKDGVEVGTITAPIAENEYNS